MQCLEYLILGQCLDFLSMNMSHHSIHLFDFNIALNLYPFKFCAHFASFIDKILDLGGTNVTRIVLEFHILPDHIFIIFFFYVGESVLTFIDFI